jgi:hypothetical protein
MTSFSIGADPEIFAQDTAGMLRSCIGLIGGTKEQPRWLDDNRSIGVQEDNVAAEYCFSPAQNEEQFVQAVTLGRSAVASLLKQHGLQLSTKASHSFDASELQHPMALVFGCDPDFNAWELKQNEKPTADDISLRSCGGHVHIGLDNCTEPMEQVRLTKLMDLHLGLWSVIEDPDNQRRKLYGTAGCFRPKSYGIEYRTLSNYWIFDNSNIRSIYTRARSAVTDFIKGENVNNEQIRTAIDTGDKKLSQYLIKTYGL